MERILLGHGSGGKLMHQLIRDHFVHRFEMKSLDDSAVLKGLGKGKVALTTDSYVVSPVFFPGGNIGELAVNGTVNDLAMVGARPLYLTAGIILEEGFLINDLKKILQSMSSMIHGLVKFDHHCFIFPKRALCYVDHNAIFFTISLVRKFEIDLKIIIPS